MERMQRRWTHLTSDQVQSLFDNTSPEIYAHGGLGEGKYMPPYCAELNGKTFTCIFEEDTYTFTFKDTHTLEWTCNNHNLYTDDYQALKAEEGVYFVQYAIRPSAPPAIRTLVMDLNTGSVTLIKAKLGNGIEPREMSRTFHFGIIKEYSSSDRSCHSFTKDLVGKAINWTYIDEMGPLKHIYSSEYFYTYVMRSKDSCWMATNPADYVRINDHLILFSFVEERQAGVQGTFLINLNTLHDVGSFAGINSTDRFECYVVGAKGEWTTMETILE